MCKNFIEIVAHKKGLWSEEIVPKKPFSFTNYRIYASMAGTVFWEYSVSLFHEHRCRHPFLNGYCINFRRALAVIHLSGTVKISGGLLHWSFLRILCFFETSTCRHTFFKITELIRWMALFYYKRAIATTHSSILPFFQDRTCSKELQIMIPWFQVCIYWNWLFLIMSHKGFAVNIHPVIAWIPRKSLLETGVIS